MNYQDFIRTKSQEGCDNGFEPNWLPDFLFDFQRSLVEWSIRKGRAAIFADCGLGKTAMQLTWAQNVYKHTGKPVLILTPLAVGSQTVAEASRFGVEAARSKDGKTAAPVTVANYERLHLFNSDEFSGVACDESSIIKHATGATQKAVTRFMSKMRYRTLWTATAAPNDYTELGTSSEALGYLGHSDMLERFFKQMDQKTTDQYERKIANLEKQANHFAKLSFRVSQAINGWRLKGHAHDHFWRWVCSWARACRKPSDIGFSDKGFHLPALNEREHMVKPERPADGMLFTLPAFGLKEERDERRRTMRERCELVAELVNHKRPAVVWCHMNAEGKMLNAMIPNSVEVCGSDSDDFKEAAAEWFRGEKCICSNPLFGSRFTTCQNDPTVTGKSIIEKIAQSASVNHWNGKQETGSAKNDTSLSITGTTGTNTGSHPKSSQSVKKEGENNTGLTLISDEKPLSLQNSTGLNIQPAEQTSLLKNTNRNSKHTKKQLEVREEFAQSVEEKKLAAGGSDSMLTTATKQTDTGECSARIVTLDSENLETVQKLLSAPSCICGHLSGDRKLISKSKIFGFGQNWQHCNHVVTFASHSYEQYYQSIRRCWRFGQKQPVTVDIIASEGEVRVRENMARKADLADKMFSELVRHMNNSLRIERTTKTIQPQIPAWL